jgi:outer membrane protein OmpA-like peptidoglycan-associated protein
MTRVLQLRRLAALTLAAVGLHSASTEGQAPPETKAVNAASAAAGARIVRLSSELDENKGVNLIDGAPVAWGANGGPPQSFVIEFASDFLITRVSFDNGNAGKVRVALSADAEDVGYIDVGEFTLENGGASQGFRLPLPQRARWVRVNVQSKYHGNDAGRVYVSEFRAMGFPAQFQTSDSEDGFRIAVAADLLFDTDKSELRPESDRAMADVLGLLREFPAATLRIDGHTDSTGTGARNQQLSQERAERIREWLDDNRGSARWNIETKGWAASKPTSSNRTESGRQRNRRVEITIVGKAAR